MHNNLAAARSNLNGTPGAALGAGDAGTPGGGAGAFPSSAAAANGSSSASNNNNRLMTGSSSSFASPVSSSITGNNNSNLTGLQKRGSFKPSSRSLSVYDEDTCRRMLSVIINSISAIHNRNASNLSFEELYRNAYNLVLQKRGEMLYVAVQLEVTQFLQGTLTRTILPRVEQAELITVVTSAWKEHVATMRMIRDILMYLDKTFVAEQKKLTIKEMGMELFASVVVHNTHVRPRLNELTMDLIARSRVGELVDLDPIRELCEMYVSLSMCGAGYVIPLLPTPPSTTTTTATSVAASATASFSIAPTKSSTTAMTMSNVPNLLVSTNKLVAGTPVPITSTTTTTSHPSQQQPGPSVQNQSWTSRVYEEFFEGPFLASTAAHYRSAALARLTGEPDTDRYLRWVEDVLREERARVRHIGLPYSTERRAMETLESELVMAHAPRLVEDPASGVTFMLREERLDGLRRLHRLVRHLHEPCQVFLKAWSGYVQGRGGDAVTSGADPVATMSSIIELKQKFERILGEALEGDKMFSRALKEALEAVVNVDARCAGHLALYSDDVLRRSGQSNGELESRLESVMGIFRLLRDKDVFEHAYKKLLAKRLLGGRSVSDEAERALVARLKSECGVQYTSKLEAMFNDTQFSETLNAKFKRAREESALSSSSMEVAPLVEMSVSVLTCGSWPDTREGGSMGGGGGANSLSSSSSSSSPPEEVRLPPEMSRLCEEYEAFYLASHSGRKLTWAFHHGTADVRLVSGLSSGLTMELGVSTYQAIILLAFNKARAYSLRALWEETRVPLRELHRHLVSLAVPRFQVLMKRGGGPLLRELKEEDVFEFNPEFKSKLRRVRVPLVVLPGGTAGGGGGGGGGEEGARMDEDGSSATVPQEVLEDRKHMVDATIVRVMKARKRLEHALLVAETLKQVRFPLAPTECKKRIESLIEREFLERDKNDSRVYNYLA